MRRIDPLAGAVLLARDVRGEDAVRHHHGAHLVGGSAGQRLRGRAGLAARHHDSRARLAEKIERRIAALGALGTVTRRRRVDEHLVVLLECPVIEAQPIGDALAEVLHEDVGLRDELVDDLFRPVLLQIEGDALLVAIRRLEVGVGHVRDVQTRHDEDTAAGIAADALFDLDHFGAEVGEHLGAVGASNGQAEVEDRDALERTTRQGRASLGIPRRAAALLRLLRERFRFTAHFVGVLTGSRRRPADLARTVAELVGDADRTDGAELRIQQLGDASIVEQERVGERLLG